MTIKAENGIIIFSFQSSLEISTSTKSHKTALFAKLSELKLISTGYILEVLTQAHTNATTHCVSKSPFLIVTLSQIFKYFTFSTFTSNLTIFCVEVAIVKAIVPCHMLLPISIFLAITTQS
ncbi:MAG: hypothetical protein LBQ24_07805 [Candidatus Peribacteria bacterium]|nr:hypothetical protein [Candidatus Peribacteria bacterium]